ncbi:MAG: DUF4292 domain-containing protein [Bacteroidota bacterium]|nr:DUF4292 domain-containing protein [Bacteroidota bacterium]
MRKNIWSKYHTVLLFFVGGFILSCKSIKPVENEKDKKILNTKKLVDSIKEYECEVEWIKLKSETSIKFEDEELEVTLNFRIKRDSLIWINASNYGVKIARAFIAKDSIKVQSEYPSKTYFVGTFDDFEKQYNLSISYPLIENFLLGNTYINELSEKNSSNYRKGKYHLFSHRKRKTSRVISQKTKKYPEYIYQSWIDPENFKCDSLSIFFPDINNEIKIYYSNRNDEEAENFPSKLKVAFLPNQYILELNHKTIKFNSPLKFPKLKITNEHERIKLNEN